jgi:hypothetical protein
MFLQSQNRENKSCNKASKGLDDGSPRVFLNAICCYGVSGKRHTCYWLYLLQAVVSCHYLDEWFYSDFEDVDL